jgi:hypothetical protein
LGRFGGSGNLACTAEDVDHAPARLQAARKPARPNRTNNLSYRGGVGGIGVENAPKVYLVALGLAVDDGRRPSGEVGILQSFFGTRVAAAG